MIRKQGYHDSSSQKPYHISIKDYSDVVSERIEYFEETGNWRSIIFLPFNMVWKILVMLSTVINCNFVAYILLYETDPGTLTFTIYYIFEGIYFINTLLSILHRAMKFRKTKSFTPKNAYLLTLDVISLLPYYELYYLLMKISYGENYEFASDTTRVKVFLRLVAVLAFFINSNNEPGLNHLLLMTVLHFVIYSLYCIVFSGIWYDFEEWKTSLTHHYINRESTVNMWLVCYAFVSSIFYHAWSGIITCVTYQEFVLVTVAMLTACVLQIIFYSNLTALFIKQISDQYYFSYRLYVIKNLLDKWKMPLSVKKLVVNFYNTFWEKRLGRSTMPKSFYDRLPASLQKEVSLDTFWDFFRHSHFFNDTDSIFNRNLCLSMKCQYYTAGEFLYTKGELKNRIVYIVSGVIQLLSMDDQNSPVISFSSGTVLGEICCLMCVESSSYLRCATYCEIQVLELKSLAYSMVKYPYISKLLWQKLNARLEIARSLQHEELIKLKSKEEKKTSIRWFKSEWRLIADLAKQGKRTYDGTEIPIVPFHFSKFLNLYVLSDEVELKVKAICLKSEFPCVLDPRNNFKTFCDNLILIVVFIQSVYLPYFIIFKRQLTMHQIGLFYTLDMFYFFALYLDASTAVRTKDRVISNIRDIIIYKGKQITIMIDIFATIPLELFAGMITDSSRATDLLHLNRVLKVYRLVKLVHNAQLNVWLDYTNLRIIKYLLLYTLTIYYLAGFVYSIVCFWECSHIGWYLYNKILKAFLNESSNSKHSSPFISSLHYVISSLLATAWKEFYAYNILDMILEQIVCAIGYYLISFCFAEMSACAVMRLKHQYDFRDRINSLKFFAQRNNLPEELARTMFRATHCHWMYSNGYEVTGQQSVIKHLPPSLKATIVTNRIVNCLKLVPLFRRCNDRTLLELAGISSIEICPPNMIVCRVNSKPTFLHVILNGYCKIESSIPTDKYHEISTTVTRGACFPILEVLMGIDTFLHVASVTYLEVIKIKRKPLLRILEHYCDNYHQLTNILTKHFEDNETVLSRRKGRLPDMVPTLRSQGRGEFFEYKCVDDVDVTEKDINEFNNTFNVIGRWKFIRHVFLRKTFEPTSTFYLRWEIFRCVVAVIQVAYALTLLKLSFIHHIYGYIELVFVVYILVDTYIRMHVRYYNDIGILVTHPLYTALHYFTSSFSVDMFGLFPIYTLQVNTIFGKSRSMNTLLIMTLITRPFLLYKVMRGFSYLQAQAKQGKILFYENCKYLLIVLLVIGMAALALEGFTCSDSDLNDQFTCPNNSWIVNPYYNEAYNAKTPTLVSFFVAFALFSSTSTATYRFLSDRYMWMVCGFSLILFAVKWFVLARITSIWIGGNKNLVQYQHNMNIFLSFCKYHRISNKLIQEAIGHYEYQWEMKKGFDISVIILKKHPVLRSDFYQFMYEKYLRMTDIFHDASQGLLRMTARHCQEFHYKKDSVIICNNDINDILYIVCKGQVNVEIADYTMTILSPGGVFGCLLPHGSTRQTITVTTDVHTTLLGIQSDRFTSLLDLDPKYSARMKKFEILRYEFLPAKSSLGYRSTVQRYKHRESVLKESIYLAKKGKSRLIIQMNATWYHIFNHIVDVHLSVWSSILISLVIIRVTLFDSKRIFYEILYFVDIIYWIKIFINFHLSYYEKETGILITNHTYIAKRYLKSVTGFWLDVFTSFPFELIFIYFQNRDWFRVFFINRSFRCVFMFLYYNTGRKRLTITRVQRCFNLMYILLIIIHFSTCFWWLVACSNDGCVLNYGNNQEGFQQLYVTQPEFGYLLSFQHVVNMFTSTGFNDMSPNTAKELYAMIVIIIVGQFITLFLTIAFANMIVLHKFMMSEYERMAKHILQYMRMTNVSRSLTTKVWGYFTELWVRSYGSWLPQLINDCPNHLKQKIMAELYGRVISDHCLFKKTHKDFQRQLVTCVEPYEFLPGMYIVEKDDIDACMYFLRAGEIFVYDKHGNNEIEQTILGPNASFGELQGIYGIPHVRSYKARFHCQILRLKKEKWIHLLKWFPASKERIEEAINNTYHRNANEAFGAF